MKRHLLYKLLLIALTAGLSACMHSTPQTSQSALDMDNSIAKDMANPNSKFMQKQRELASKCFLPADQRDLYKTAEEEWPPKRRPYVQQRKPVNGCASTKFKLDAQGNVTEAAVLTEYPKGYDFGDDLIISLHNTTYKPPASTEQWYYTMTVTSFPGNDTP